MHRIETPPFFGRLSEIGGVLDVAVFRNARGTLDEIVAAMPEALPWSGPFDGARLLALGARRIDRKTFLGDWVDERGALVRRGSWRSDDGRAFENPPFGTLDGVTLVSGGFSPPEPGAGGQFGYAVSCPPYPLSASPRAVQAVFDGIRAFLLPEGKGGEIEVEILDWSHPELGEVSGYFAAGLEWWGVFLFSLYLPVSRRLTLIAASATD